MERRAKDGTYYRQVGADAWEPVTRQAKDGTSYKKVGPDDWAPIEQAKPKEESGPSKAESALIGLQEGATFGARPFIAGVAGGLGQAVGSLQNGSNGWAEKLKAVPGQFSEGFSQAKKEARDESDYAAKINPGAFASGQVGGALLTAPLAAVRGAQAAKGATSVLSGTRAAAKVGAAMGGAQALGRADNAEDAMEMIGSGALLGGGLQGAGNAVSKYGKSALHATGRGAKSIASNLTGIPEKTIETYAKRAVDISKMMSKAGGDISEASDIARGNISREIQVTRQKLNQQISKSLANPEFGDIAIDARPLLQAVDDQLAKIGGVTAGFRPGEISELKNVRDQIAKTLNENGSIPAKVLHELKQELQLIASPSYNGGQAIFPRGDLAARGAKGAAAEAKRLLDVAIPDLARANQQLSRLHAIEQNMNKNLIRAGKPESALIAAGSGANARGAKILQSIDNITGGTAMKQAEDLAAAKTFGKVSFNPMDATGKSLARMATGAGVGYVTGGEQGAMLGAALSSPAALKAGLDASRAIGRVGSSTGGRAIQVAASAIRRPEATSVLTNQSIRNRAETIASRSMGQVAESQNPSPANRDENRSVSNSQPLRGRNKWASDGYDRVEKALGAGAIGVTREQVLADNQLRDYFIQASNLDPKSKAFQRVVDKIKARVQPSELDQDSSVPAWHRKEDYE